VEALDARFARSKPESAAVARGPVKERG